MDVVIFFFVFSLVWTEPAMRGVITELASHVGALLDLHSFFHPEHLPTLSELASYTVHGWSHVFFAIFIVLTFMEAYKGQTPGSSWWRSGW